MNFNVGRIRELVIVTLACLCVSLISLQTLASPYVAMAIPLTLIALYIPLIRTLIITTVTAFTAIIAIKGQIITPAANLSFGNTQTLFLILSSIFVLPMLASIAMSNIREQQNKIRVLSERLDQATSSSGLGVWEWDTMTRKIYWNEQMFKLYEIKDKRITINRKIWLKAIDTQDKQFIDDAIRQALSGAQVAPLNFGITTENETKKILRTTISAIKDKSGRVTKLIGINSDFTQSHNTEALLEQKSKIAQLAQQESVLLFEMAPDPLILTNTIGIIQKANGAAHILFGYGNGELLQANINQLFPENTLNQIIRYQDNQSESKPSQKKEAPNQELIGRSIDGVPIPVELVQQIIHHNDESAIIVSIRDMTEQKRVAADISKAKQLAENANHAKSEFIANMSHEIRTPLNATLGTVMLLQNTQLSNMQLGYLQMIKDSGESLLGILNDILDISKIEAGRMELSPIEFCLENILQQTASIMTVNSSGKSLDLSIKLNSDVSLNFFGDPLRLQQVLTNLVSNAIKFTEKGSVELAINYASIDNEHAVLEFSITDTGIGISDDKKNKLFSAFSQADNSITRKYGGTGLGLLISKRLIEMMGGKIVLESEVGVGSTFRFTTSLIESPSNKSQNTPEFKVNILLVESRPSIYQSIIEIFKRWELPHTHSTCNHEAMDLIRMNGPFDVIIVGGESGEIHDNSLLHNRPDIESSNTAIIIINHNQCRELVAKQVNAGLVDCAINLPITTTNLSKVLNQVISKNIEFDSPNSENKVNQTMHLAGISLLLVEDNKMNQTVAKGLLEQFGATVEIAEDGLQAIAQLKAKPEGYQVILMDVQMPNLDGFSATTIIRNELNNRTPILAMSAGVMISEKNKCREVGMEGFISKPIVVEDMLNAILTCTDKPKINQQTLSRTVIPEEENRLFNPQRLLKYIKGNSDRYRSIIEMIRNVVHQGLSPFHEAVEFYNHKDFDKARRAFHTLKGSLGNLGALDAWECAQKIELALSDGQPKSMIQYDFDELESQLEKMFSEAKLWLKSQDSIDTPRNHLVESINPNKKTSQDKIEYYDNLNELCILLRNNNMKAFDSYGAIKNTINTQLNTSESTTVSQAIQNFDFSQALKILERINQGPDKH